MPIRISTYKPTDLTHTALDVFAIDNLTRRRFIIGAGALGLGVLTGCGAGEQAAAPTATVASNGYPRTVNDFLGSVAIPTQPQRVLTYADFALDTMLALDVQPALLATYAGHTLLPHQTAAASIQRIEQTSDGISIEKIVAERIDLIIMTANTAVWGKAKEQLADARVPILTLPEGDFEGQLRIVGEALAVEQKAAAKAVEVATLFADYTPPRVPQTIKAFGTYGDGTFYMFKPQAGLSKMMEQFGMPPLSVPTNVGDADIDPEAVHSISLELAQALEADLLIGTNYGDEQFDTVVTSPIFQQLAVVKAGRFATFNYEESFAIAYGSVLTIPTARDLLTRALSL